MSTDGKESPAARSTRQRFKQRVNMTGRELERWAENPLHKLAALEPDSGDERGLTSGLDLLKKLPELRRKKSGDWETADYELADRITEQIDRLQALDDGQPLRLTADALDLLKDELGSQRRLEAFLRKLLGPDGASTNGKVRSIPFTRRRLVLLNLGHDITRADPA